MEPPEPPPPSRPPPGPGWGAPRPPSLAPPPRTLGQILDAAFDLVRGHAPLLVGLSALLYVPIAFLGEIAPPPESSGEPDGALPKLPPWAAGVFLLVLLGLPVVVAAVTDACGSLARGRPADPGSALARGFALALPLVGTYLLFGLLAVATMLPLGALAALWEALPGPVRFAGVVAGVALPFAVLLRLSLLTQVAVLEEVFGPRALARANRLIDGQVLRVFGVFFVVGLLVAVLGGAASVAVGSLPWAGPALVGLVQAAGFAYTTAVGVVLYDDVRVRRGESVEPPPPAPGPFAPPPL